MPLHPCFEPHQGLSGFVRLRRNASAAAAPAANASVVLSVHSRANCDDVAPLERVGGRCGACLRAPAGLRVANCTELADNAAAGTALLARAVPLVAALVTTLR